jgi:UDP-N-acetylmuramoylalanine--D-glutamate ligase
MTHSNSQLELIAIVGLGQSGLAAARYFERTKQAFFAVDTNLNFSQKAELEALEYCQSCYLGEMPESQLSQASMIILSPGISLKHPGLVKAIEQGVEIMGDIELFARQLLLNKSNKKIVAITGSNGKSTVTDLTCKLLNAAGLKAKIGGNFGIPVCDYLPCDDADVYVLELSSFQLETTRSLQADIATVLNVSQDHLDRYDSFEAYQIAKLAIYNGAKKCLVNADDELTYSQGSLNATSEAFSLIKTDCKYYIDPKDHSIYCDQVKVTNAKELNLSGKHNWANALTSLALLNELNVAITPKVISTLKDYTGLAHRFEKVYSEKNKAGLNIDWVNDSKATNVGATVAAINSVDFEQYQQLVLIAGGDAKGADLSQLKPCLEQKVEHCILLGKDAERIAALLPQQKCSKVADMNAAVKQAKQLTQSYTSINQQKSVMVLLSPACASIDMFSNFKARGQAFIDSIKECA